MFFLGWFSIRAVSCPKGAVLNLENPPLVLALLQILSILQYSSIPRSTLFYSWEPGRRLPFSEFMRVIFVSPFRWQITWERWSSHAFLELPPTSCTARAGRRHSHSQIHIPGLSHPLACWGKPPAYRCSLVGLLTNTTGTENLFPSCLTGIHALMTMT